MNIDKLIGGVLLILGFYALKSWYKGIRQIEEGVSPFTGYRILLGGIYLILAGILLFFGLGTFLNASGR